MARTTTDAGEAASFKLASSPSHLLHRAEQLATERFAQLVGDTITLRQFTILAGVAETPGLSQSELVRATGIDRSTIGEMISRMEKRGWLVRTPSRSDARAHSLQLSQAGAAMLSAVTKHARAADAAILDLLPRTKARTFVNTLTKLAKIAEAAAAKAEREARREAKRQARQQAKAKRKQKPAGKRP
ncbi:MAG: MarR family transcriptional regulator [Hyphomonadaceae bacterium]